MNFISYLIFGITIVLLIQAIKFFVAGSIMLGLACLVGIFVAGTIGGLLMSGNNRR